MYSWRRLLLGPRGNVQMLALSLAVGAAIYACTPVAPKQVQSSAPRPLERGYIVPDRGITHTELAPPVSLERRVQDLEQGQGIKRATP